MKLKDLVLIGVGFIIGFMVNECTHTPCEFRIDTVTVTKTKRDTIWGDTNKVTKKSFSPKPKMKFFRDIKGLQKTYTVYQDSLVDSNVAITVTDTLEDGVIKNKEIAYRLKVPLRIIDSITIEKTITIEKQTNGFYLGAELGTNLKGFRLAPEIEYVSKGFSYSYNYDLLNKYHSIGIKKRL
jgi:hypothetical protein